MIGYNNNVLQQTAYLVIIPIMFGNFAFLFKCMPMGRTLETLWRFRHKNLSIDEMVGPWYVGCLSGPRGFTC